MRREVPFSLVEKEFLDRTLQVPAEVIARKLGREVSEIEVYRLMQLTDEQPERGKKWRRLKNERISKVFKKFGARTKRPTDRLPSGTKVLGD